MIKDWILRKFGYIPLADSREVLGRETAQAVREIARLKTELLGKESEQKKNRRVIDTSIGDVEPSDGAARASYVASASNFYTGILEKKLMQMIAQIREEMDTVSNPIPYGMTRAEYDHYLRGTSNAFKLLMDHYERLKGEHLSNIKPNE